MNLAEYLSGSGISGYADWSTEVEMAFPPRPYQFRDLNHMAVFLPRCGLFSDPGIGKTLPMQALMVWLAGLGNKPIAIMPPNLVTQFRVSLSATFKGVDNHLHIGVIHGELKERQKQIAEYNSTGWPTIMVMSYPTFLGKQKIPRVKATGAEDHHYEFIPHREITALSMKWQALQHLGYNSLVCDEAHKLKNHSSEIHIAVRDFADVFSGDESNGLVLATGSPIETNVEDAYGLIALLDPQRYGTKRAFDNRHCILADTPYRKVVKYQNLDYLEQALYAKGRRVTKRQAFPDMPPRVVTEVQVDLSATHRKLYDTLVEEQMLELPDKLIDATAASAMYQLCQKILISPDLYSEKPVPNAVLDSVDELIVSLGKRKVILYCWYQESAETLMARYAKLNPVLINGTVNSEAAREKAKRAFIDDPNCRVLVANPQSGGVGLDGFQHVCSYAVFVEVCPWTGRMEQAIARLERSGQMETTNIYIMVPKKTIAVKLRNDLVRKEALANQVVCDKKTLLEDLMGLEGIQGVIK